MKAIILTSNGFATSYLAARLAERLALLLGLTNLAGVRMAYIPNAADPLRNKNYQLRSQKLIRALGVDLHLVDLEQPRAEVRRQLVKAAVLYVEGGNTFHLMYHLRQSGLDKDLKEYSHLIYVGSSAGSIVAGPNVQAAVLAGDVNRDIDQTDLRGLGLVSFIIWPHYALWSSWRLFFSMPGRGRHRALFFTKVIPLRNGEAIVIRPGHRRERLKM